MKRVILLIAAAITFGFSVSAQDVILLKSAEEIKCKVVELKYRKSEMPDGPLYSLPLGEIFSVTYANGHRETFKNFSQTSNIQQPKFANASTKGEYPYPPVSRAYRIGEIFDEGGVKGVVIHTTDDGRHGLIISLVESDDTAWGYVKHGERVEVFETKARSLIDGWQNMKIIEEIVKNTPLTWSNFPAFQWCRELGAGWYLPAIEELEKVWNLANGKPIKEADGWKSQKQIKQYFESLGQYPMFDYAPFRVYGYLSSTECDYYTIWMLGSTNSYDYKQSRALYEGTAKTKPNQSGLGSNKYFGLQPNHVRAVHKF